MRKDFYIDTVFPSLPAELCESLLFYIVFIVYLERRSKRHCLKESFDTVLLALEGK